MSRLPKLTYLYPSAVAHLLWTFTLGLFFPKCRRRIAQLGYEAPWFLPPVQERPALPVQPLAEIVGRPEKITLYEPELVAGNVSLLELLVLARLTEKLQPTTIFEFGTFDGRSTLNLIAHAATNARVYTLDLSADMAETTKYSALPGETHYIHKPRSGERFKNSPYAANISQLYGDSATFDFSPYFGRMDLVFIDASHAYDYVRCDTLNALKLLKPSGGLILWHDYTPYWSDVIRALNEFAVSEPRLSSLKQIEGTTLVMLRV